MTTINKMLCAVFTLMLVNVSTAQADSSNFAGPYVGVSGSGYGMQLDGESRSQSGGPEDSSEEDSVSIGQVAPVLGFEVGYALPLGSNFLIDIGGTYYNGEAEIKAISDGTAGNNDVDAKFKVDDLVSGYIAPTIVLSDTSSVYVKHGLTEADTGVVGNEVTSPANLSGTTWAIGSRTQLENGLYIRTEAGYTEFNGISAHGKGNGVATTTSVSAEPTSVYGSVSLGFRF